MTTVIDTNVILDIVINDPQWRDWSLDHLAEALVHGPVVMCAVVFAEISSRQNTVGEVEEVLSRLELTLQPLSNNAMFLAGQAFARYRRTGGTKTNVLPDFFIGAQAADLKVPLLTRDTRRYRSYFPQLELIAP